MINAQLSSLLSHFWQNPFSSIRSFGFLLCLFLSNGPLQGQSAILEAYIQEGLAANLSVRQQDIAIASQQEALRQSKALSLPKFTFDANYILAAGGRKIDFPIGDLLNPVYDGLYQIQTMTPGAKSPIQLENQAVPFLPNNFHETKISFAYPIFNSDIGYNRQIQTQLLAQKAAQKATTQHELRYQITEAYLNYTRALEAEKIWINAKTVLTELKRFNESLVKNEVATRDVVSTAQYELSKADQEIFQLRSQQNNARAYFNYLINKDLQAAVLVDSTLLQTALPAYQSETLVQQSLDNRAELDALQAGLQAAETDIRRNSANQKLPDFYLGGSFGFQGFAYTFNRDQLYALAQVGLTYDLFDGGIRKSKTQEARLQAESLRNTTEQARQQIALQVTAAWNDLQAAQNILQTTAVGLIAAEESARITQNKYRAGQLLLLEWLDAQNRVTTARLQQVLAQSEVLLREAALRKAVGI